MHDPAIKHLRRSDPVMRSVIGAVGPCLFEPGARGDNYTTLARAICGQQLSTKAAETIWQRVLAAQPMPGRLRPDDVLAMPDETLRGCGLSAAKLASIRDLSARIADGRLKLATIGRKTDDAILASLVEVRGIGVWTAEMFLMFKLGRPDVWAVGDLGLRNAVKRHYRIEPTVAALNEIAEPWRPYRSVASWYLWRSLDIAPV